ncbi:ribosomal protein S6 kinase delta-1 [Astyanax mexicanus]|uniref:ribosomal protein S6 kinase delta-1 n=1 Tax=Astyanax mexicanus TaxID=7994 RepID=UPI0020CB4125|nr:ribosomal protein S6 kinase delta-1 [Astyanax mexicanus]
MISQRERGELARFYTVTDPKKHRKGYTVYKVTARIISRKNPEDVQEITVWKRYSDFKKLHKDLWQIHRNLYRQSELFPPFAKAKVFGRFDESVIEERRQCSEDLLQFSANIPALYGSQHIQDFFKDGEVQDGSDLIGPAEPFSDFLADSLSDSSSDVHKDIGGVDDLTVTSQSEYGGPSSDSDLISLLVDGDSLAELDDGMASGRSSPNLTAGGSRRDVSPSRPELEPSRVSKAALFPSSLCKKDYLEKASEQIGLAVQKEVEQDFAAAFSYYRSGVDLLLQGVQGEASPSRREAVKKKTAEYLMRAELISSTHLKDSMGQNSTQNRALAAQCCKGSWGQQTQADELSNYRVLGVIDKVLLVMDKRTQEMFVLKGLRKSSECGRVKKTVVPRTVPNMVRLRKFIVCEDSIFLLLHYAEGGKLWSHITKYLHQGTPEESFDIPFIQKSHTASVRCAERLDPALASSDSAGSHPSLEQEEEEEEEEEGTASLGLPQLSTLSLRDNSLQAPPPGSGDTSEEECTNSYLTLCNEYEQEKIEPGTLGDEEKEDAEEAEEDSCITAGEGSGIAAATSLSRTRSLISGDSLCSPITTQELRFFTEDEDLSDPRTLDTLDSLDRSKRSPMELFRIDSKDSADLSRGLFSTSDLGSEVTEDPLEVGEVVEVKGHVTDLWRFDSDQGSNESVPVISFKDAMVEDEGRPPDLLVNLPRVRGGTGVTVDDLEEELVAAGVAFAVEAKPSPKFGKPDVLQLGEEAGLDLSLKANNDEVDGLAFSNLDKDSNTDPPSIRSNAVPNKLSSSLSPSNSLTPLPQFSELLHSTDPRTEACPTLLKLSAQTGSEVPEITGARVEREGRSVTELFRELDELAEVALHTHIPETLVRSWAVDMLLALDALHQEGVICKDLNPNNILLDHRGHVELTYFCSWNEVEESCDPDAVSKMFCAPEVGGISEETAACDWWSLGAVLYELLTGKSLHQCHPAGISRHTSLNIPDFVSEEARSLLEQLLQYNPVERLGAGVAGVEDIKSHPFFARVDWPK